MRPEGMLRAVFVRSPHPHALIRGIDTAAALAAPGVAAVYTAADLAAAGLTDTPGGYGVGRPDGSPAPNTRRPALVADRVRHEGEAVAMVVAATLAQALDAADLVDVDYDPQPPVFADTALTPGAPAVWDIAPGNVAFRWEGGDAPATSAALAGAAHVTRQTIAVTRVTANAMEPRNVLAALDPDGRLAIHASHQSPYTLRAGMEAAGFPKGSVTVRIGDVGGSFGLKMGVLLESIPVGHAARALGRPVMWESTRNEGFAADDHAREMTADAAIGFDDAGRIVGFDVRAEANLGAYVSSKSIWSVGNIGGLAGVYDIPAIHAEVWGVLTNTGVTAAYRGAGRPEATYILERMLDLAAAEMGVSPMALRRRNLIPPAAMPYETGLVFTYDCGDFAANMDMAEEMADLAGFPARQAEAASRGKLRGLGLSNAIEIAGGPFKVYAPDIARISLLTDGRLRVQSGSMSVGQGLETVYPQMVADRFGVDTGAIDYLHGDTDAHPWGRGNGGSSALCVGGPAVGVATEALEAKLKDAAAAILDVAPDSVTLSDGVLRSPAANRTLTLAELAGAIQPEGGGVAMSGTGEFKPEAGTFPNGTHICEVEVDPDTGAVAIVGYWAVEDIGTVVNPALAEGQIHGGIVQGIGQAIGEVIAYTAEGQLLTGSFMDYQMPRADDLPALVCAFNPVPTAVNPLGAKGVGEAGTVGALAATLSAVNAALAPLGVRHLDMPMTPARVWQAIRGAR
jgi:carbon-monoxide dehydrogenase large subunit